MFWSPPSLKRWIPSSFFLRLLPARLWPKLSTSGAVTARKLNACCKYAYARDMNLIAVNYLASYPGNLEDTYTGGVLEFLE